MKGPKESTTPIDRVLALLKHAHSCGNGWTAHCPAHHDRKSSLSIREGEDGRVLLKCHAGCSTKEIVAALSLDMKDLFLRGHTKHREKARDRAGLTVEEYAEAKRLPVKFLRKHGVED